MIQQYAERVDARQSIAERLTPFATPALAIQSYEYFGASGQDDVEQGRRVESRNAFIDGEVDTITLKYPKLPDGEAPDFLRNEREQLEQLMRDLRDPETVEFSDEVSEMIFHTALFRYKEIEFVATVRELNRTDITNVERVALAEKYRRLNEMLYGKADPKIVNGIKGEIWRAIDSKEHSPEAQILVNELRNGFVTERGIAVNPLNTSQERLPVLSSEAAAWIKEMVLEEYGEYRELIQAYWDTVVVPRHRDKGAVLGFTSEDIYMLFVESLAILDSEGKSGIKIDRNDNTITSSWNTPTMSVIVGTQERPKPITSVDIVFGTVLHELAKGHGLRTKNGLETDAPILGFGIFSDFDPEEGELPDYLTFEEGSEMLTQAIVAGELTSSDGSQWDPSRFRTYLSIALADSEQRSSREVYEITWRYTLLMRLTDGEVPSNDDIISHKKMAALTLERYERGIPEDLPPSVGRIGFTKDLAYVAGRCKALKVYEAIASRKDKVSFRNLAGTKTDPTNRRQREFAAKYGYSVDISMAE